MQGAAYSCEVSTAIYKVQRVAVQSIQGTWDALLAEEQTRLHTDLPIDSTSVSCLSQLLVPVLVSLRSFLFDDPFWDDYKGNQPFD